MPRGKALVDDRARAWRRFEAHPWRITVTRSHALAFTSLLAYSPLALAQEAHSHAAAEKLGAVEFATTCKPSVQPAFERGVALLHSFAYAAADAQFREVAAADPDCAIAHWGIAMAIYHQLWDTPTAADVEKGATELAKARSLAPKSEREREFIYAAGAFFGDPATPHAQRAKAYEIAMADVAKRHPDDSEAQVAASAIVQPTRTSTMRLPAQPAMSPVGAPASRIDPIVVSPPPGIGYAGPRPIPTCMPWW